MSFVAEPTLAGLKRFQRDTVEYVFDRYYGSDPVDRFLVADEVGLGKTMVAKGVIAKLIEHHLQESGRRIDIVYVCSNQAIAQQNFSKLAIVGRRTKAVTDRITTLPLHVGGLNTPVEGFDRGINIIPITPTTSLDLRSSVGRVDERALLWWLFSDERLGVHELIRRKGARRIFMPPVAELSNFDDVRKSISAQQIDPDLWSSFVTRVNERPGEGPPVAEEIVALADAFRSERRVWAPDWSKRRIQLVARLRRLLAAACVHALEPDLVILDEFQRFPRLLDESEPTGELAKQLFDYPGCKSLLLSATPYRMFSRAQELDEDHYSDFMTTTRFLLGDERKAKQLERHMDQYRTALRESATSGTGPVKNARNRVRKDLLRVMCRTERLGADRDRNGMLEAYPSEPLTAALAPGDLSSYAELDRIARALGARDVVEFWKSAPYALSLMDDYQLTREFVKQAGRKESLRVRHQLPRSKLHRYGKVDPGNARLRGLLDRLDREGAWKCLWLPPSLPYYAATKPFSDVSIATKRLIFSSWKVVPKAIASLVSYDIERRLVEHLGREVENTSEGRKALGQPLQWRADGAMTELLLAMPGRELARLTDPLVLARDHAHADRVPPPRKALVQAAERAVAERLKELSLPSTEGRADPAWYIVAMLRLDEVERTGSVRDWLREDVLRAEVDSGVLRQQLLKLLRSLDSDEELGPVPSDLAQVLAYVGLAGPGTSSLRALTRINPHADGAELRGHALTVGNALRAMLNHPEAVLAVRSFSSRRARIQTSDQEIYWRAALDYCAAGNLQAVLDEYMHVLSDWVGGSTPAARVQMVADTAAEAIGVKAAPLSARHILQSGRIAAHPLSFRSRFALRLDRSQGEDQQSVQRIDTVRKAFNSPFWPFVLATTSIGQEGLDFHLYSHAVVHWNLPHNPVDLEQREGRVHRFKNHAVRRNLATAHRSAAMSAAPADPWAAMFEAVPQADGGLKPYWVFTGHAKIERHVPAEPLSIDGHRLEELVRLMGIYRLAFGQPRQDEFLAALGNIGEDIDDLVIRLNPRRTSRRSGAASRPTAQTS